MADDAAIIGELFGLEGASTLKWERGTRCDCLSGDTQQPRWGCPTCDGYGVTYEDAGTVKGLFRSQSRWEKQRAQGELSHGEAQITLPPDVKPAYTDRRVRDRFTVLEATGDVEAGRVFYPAAQPVPFMFGNVLRAWRVQLQSLEQSDRLVPQP